MKNRKLLIFIILLLLIVLSNHYWNWSAYLMGDKAYGLLEKLIQENLIKAVGLYFVFTIAGCVLLALPGISFAILAGLMFGPVLGTICCSLATSLGAMLAFLAGRYFLKDSIGPLVRKNPHLRKWLFEESGRNAFFVLMITRLVPVFPYNLQNFAYGITEISFVSYSLGSFLFMLPGTAMYTLGAVGLVDSDNRILYLGSAALLALLVVGISRFLKNRYVEEKANG